VLPGDQHGFVTAGCFVKQAIKLFASFAGIHAGHTISERVALRRSKSSAPLLRQTAKKLARSGPDNGALPRPPHSPRGPAILVISIDPAHGLETQLSIKFNGGCILDPHVQRHSSKSAPPE
jgi:hypothetical protein